MVRHLRRICFSFTHILSMPQEIFGSQRNARFLMTSQILDCAKREARKKAKVHQIITLDSRFDKTTRNKDAFLEVIDNFKKKNPKTGIIEFIYVALKRMQQYNVHEDLEVYKKLIDLMPKGSMISPNFILADTMWYPKHQRCITTLLLQMEENRVYPDRKLYDLLLTIFGRKSWPVLKYRRMQYWMPKFKNLNPWIYPKLGVEDKIESAKLALKRMGDLDLENEVTVFQTKEDKACREDTWIASCQSPTQRKLIYYHPKNVPIYVEGPYWLYLERKDRAQYYVLRSELPKNRRRRQFRDPDVIKNLKIPFFDPPTPDDLVPEFSVHEQRDGIIFAMCITGTNSKQSLLSWIRFLESHGNSRLEEIPILFRSCSPSDGSTQGDQSETEESTRLIEDGVEKFQAGQYFAEE